MSLKMYFSLLSMLMVGMFLSFLARCDYLHVPFMVRMFVFLLACDKFNKFSRKIKYCTLSIGASKEKRMVTEASG